jgi:hypothetical protein
MMLPALLLLAALTLIPILYDELRGLAWIFCNVRATDGQLANVMVAASDNSRSLPAYRF